MIRSGPMVMSLQQPRRKNAFPGLFLPPMAPGRFLGVMCGFGSPKGGLVEGGLSPARPEASCKGGGFHSILGDRETRLLEA